MVVNQLESTSLFKSSGFQIVNNLRPYTAACPRKAGGYRLDVDIFARVGEVYSATMDDVSALSADLIYQAKAPPGANFTDGTYTVRFRLGRVGRTR